MTKTKKKLTPLPKLVKQVQALANRYARERDCFGQEGGVCISCDKWFPFEQLDGGHYRPTTHSNTRFHEININAQCHKCNRFLHGNLTGYFRGLEKKIGRAVLDELDAAPRIHKWTREELNELKQYYKDKLSDLRRGIPPTTPRKLHLPTLQERDGD